MQWYQHPHFVKYEVNYLGVIRNRRTKRVLKLARHRNYARPKVHVIDYGGKLKQRNYGAFVLEAINNVKNIEDFIYIDGDNENNNYFNLKEVAKIPKGRRVAQISANGSIIKIWNSIKEAMNVGGFCEQSIILNCKGKIKSHGGYHWCYEKDIPNTKVTLLVATKDGEVNYFDTTKQAFTFFKSRKIIDNTLPLFRTSISKAKNKDRLFLGYRWTTIEKHIESWGNWYE